MSREPSIGEEMEFWASTAWSWLALAVASIILFTDCVFAATNKPVTTIHVEADLYSGSENPAWNLQELEAAHFLSLIQSLTEIRTRVSAQSDVLGYRGLKVTITSDGVAIQRLKIDHGVVFAEGAHPEDRRILSDADRAVEKWLLPTGRKSLGAGLLESLLNG